MQQHFDKKTEKGIIFDIQRNSFVDGPGIRTSIFFKGCNLKCAWCHNPESQSRKTEMMFYKNKCIGCGKCREVCPYSLTNCMFCGKCELYCQADARRICGREYTTDEIMAEIVKDKSFYENSGGGVTFSGGECMLQIDFLCEMLKKCKAEGINTAIDTAGNVPWKYFERILKYTDLFLYDIKIFENEKHIKYTGFENTIILDNLKKLFESGAKVWIRIPIIGGVNDNVEEIGKIKSFLMPYQPLKIELLPYHDLGINKYDALHMQKHIFKAPDKGTMEELKLIFKK